MSGPVAVRIMRGVGRAVCRVDPLGAFGTLSQAACTCRVAARIELRRAMHECFVMTRVEIKGSTVMHEGLLCVAARVFHQSQQIFRLRIGTVSGEHRSAQRNGLREITGIGQRLRLLQLPRDVGGLRRSAGRGGPRARGFRGERIANPSRTRCCRRR